MNTERSIILSVTSVTEICIPNGHHYEKEPVTNRPINPQQVYFKIPEGTQFKISSEPNGKEAVIHYEDEIIVSCEVVGKLVLGKQIRFLEN